MEPYYYIQKYLPEYLPTLKKIVEVTFDGDTTPSQVYSSLFDFLYDHFKQDTLSEKIVYKSMLIIEETLGSGDKAFQTAVSLSFLEDITNSKYVNMYRVLEPFFQDRTKSEIQKIYTFWKSDIK